MSKCYICNRELIERNYYEQNIDSFNDKPAINHKEHIIPNALHGRFKAENILCSDCGGILSKSIDSPFCSLFNVITEQLKHVLITKDHGKSNEPPVLKGYLYKDESFKEKIEINYKDKKVSPENPYYELDTSTNKLTIFANKRRAKHFKEVVLNELREKGIKTGELVIEVKTDIEDQRFLGLFFTENIQDFNAKFKKGFCKIAVEFALHKGIKREGLKNVLKINTDQTAEHIDSKNLIPFFPLSSFDKFYETNRLDIETNYPTHEIILFTQHYTNNTKKLFCFISLFSTFQYYVLLNDKYTGPDVVETYCQTVLKQEFPDINIRSIRPKHLSIIVHNFGIDTSKYKGESLSDYIDFIEKEYKNLKAKYELDIFGELKESASVLLTSFTLLEHISYRNVIKSFADFPENQTIAFLREAQAIHEDSFIYYKRSFFEDDGHGQLENLSYPDELIKEMNRNSQICKAYGHLKFGELSKFIEKNKSK
jgi:hypothetical protein